jgi:hypothetical protein
MPNLDDYRLDHATRFVFFQSQSLSQISASVAIIYHLYLQVAFITGIFYFEHSDLRHKIYFESVKFVRVD